MRNRGPTDCSGCMNTTPRDAGLTANVRLWRPSAPFGQCVLQIAAVAAAVVDSWAARRFDGEGSLIAVDDVNVDPAGRGVSQLENEVAVAGPFERVIVPLGRQHV